MPLSHKALPAITEADLQALVEGQKDKDRESKRIDYKESLLLNSPEDKKEFLADVSSFANASGGDLILGVKEQSGIPTAICGLGAINPDAEVLRIENLIRDGIEPRIPGIEIRPVSLRANGFVIIIRIPKSWALPHVVNHQKRWRFYSRNSAGKYPLDVNELRALFALSETSAEQIRNFRAERLNMIVAGETPIALAEYPKFVLHLVPLRAFEPSVRFDMSPLESMLSLITPIVGGGASLGFRHNFDGYLTYIPPHQGRSISYLQIFRNGCIEAVEAEMLRPKNGKGKIPGSYMAEELSAALGRFLSVQKTLGVTPPLFVMLSLMGVSGYTMVVGPDVSIGPDQFIEKDMLLIPEVMVESFENDPMEVMKPLFDIIWNAAGFPRSQ